MISTNKGIEESLSNKGYVVIDLLRPEDVAFFLSEWSKICPDISFENYCSILSPDPTFNLRVNTLIKSLLDEHLSALFPGNYPIDAGSVLIKGTLPDALIAPHMDPTLVDETRFSTFNVWIPMIDVNEKNGCLHIYTDYDYIKKYFVKRPCNNDAPNPMPDFVSDFWQKSKAIPLRAGQALIFDHKLPHASNGNLTIENRIAVSVGIIPREAQMFIYYQNEELYRNNKIKRYWVKYDSFSNRDEHGLPREYDKVEEINQFPTVFFARKKLKALFASK